MLQYQDGVVVRGEYVELVELLTSVCSLFIFIVVSPQKNPRISFGELVDAELSAKHVRKEHHTFGRNGKLLAIYTFLSRVEREPFQNINKTENFAEFPTCFDVLWFRW